MVAKTLCPPTNVGQKAHSDAFSRILATDLTNSFTEQLVIAVCFPYLVPEVHKKFSTPKITKIDAFSPELECNMIQRNLLSIEI